MPTSDFSAVNGELEGLTAYYNLQLTGTTYTVSYGFKKKSNPTC